MRLAGVETGEYHHAMFVKQDSYDRVKALPALEPRIVKPRGWAVAVLNHKAGPMMQKKLRQAVQAALDMEPILAGGFGSRDFYRLDPGLFFPEQPWQLDRVVQALQPARQGQGAAARQGVGLHRPADPVGHHARVRVHVQERAGRQAAAGRSGTLSIDLQVVDWATLNHRTEKPELWEIFSTGFVFSADPANHVALRCTFQGWWCNEEKERLLGELQVEMDLKKRKAIVDRIQTVFYEEVGSVKLGDYFTLDVARRDLRGDFRTAPRLYFWNSWLAK